MDRLVVQTFDGQQVGVLSFDAEADLYSLVYCDAWLNHELRYPLSLALHFDSPKSPAIKRYLENLLPEGSGLDAIAQSNHLSRSNVFGLIRAVGQESAGAMMLTPLGAMAAPSRLKHRRIDDLELMSRIASRNWVPFSVWDGKVRLSIAGFQDKIAVFIDEGDAYLVEHPLASTHILKPLPQSSNLATVVANEHFCMRLAGLVGVGSAETRIKRVPAPVLVVERFDRRFDASRALVERLHVIDACQLLDIPPAYKYERNLGDGKDVANIREGASLKRIFAMSDFAEHPFDFKRKLLRWVILQYLIGNADAHAKNLSFHVLPGGKLRLALTYDLVSTVIYNGLDESLAMSIGDAFKFKDIGAYQWALFAYECGIPVKFLVTELRRMLVSASRQIDAEIIDPTLLTHAESIDIRKIKDFIGGQIAQLQRDVTTVTEAYKTIKRDDGI